MQITQAMPVRGAGSAASGSDYLRSRWDDAVVASLDPVQRLIYRSNLLGADARITNTGGGNTSSKIEEQDPITGESAHVLWVKGSGGDLRTAHRGNFASLYLDRLIDLQEIYARFPERGPKTPAEDAMVGMYAHATFDRNPTAPSIDTRPMIRIGQPPTLTRYRPINVAAPSTIASAIAICRGVTRPLCVTRRGPCRFRSAPFRKSNRSLA